MSIAPSFLDAGFLIALLILGLARWLWPSRHFVIFGTLGSAALVGLAAPATFAAVTLITLGFLFPLHRFDCWAREQKRAPWISSVIIPAGVGLLVAALVVSKVYRHFTLPLLAGQRLGGELVSLVGFSYFIFRAIGFLHIQSILRFKETSPWGLLFFTLFPPTLTAGPIQKYQDFRQQLADPQPLSAPLLTTVGYRVTRGYFRKMVVAFFLNEWVTRLLAIEAPNVYISVLVVALLYLYFYFDFAGYSDIAIALGLLLGIKVPENFRKPFLATTVSEFWRNWHITLVDWFRDNVFIPLGGMQGSRLRAGALSLIVMVLCGLWHGLALNFLMWGAWHGIALLGEAVAGTKPIPPALRRGPRYWLRVFWTNSLVAFPCVLFLPDTEATLRILSGFTNWTLA